MYLNSPVKVTSKMNGKVMTLSEGEFKSRPGDLIASNYTGASKQKFMFSTMNEVFMIKNLANGSVLDVEGGSSTTYSTVLCYKHHGNKNQLWKVFKESSVENAFYIMNIKSNQVLEIEGGIDADGMRIVQNVYYKNLNQLWSIEQV